MIFDGAERSAVEGHAVALVLAVALAVVFAVVFAVALAVVFAVALAFALVFLSVIPAGNLLLSPSQHAGGWALAVALAFLSVIPEGNLLFVSILAPRKSETDNLPPCFLFR